MDGRLHSYSQLEALAEIFVSAFYSGYKCGTNGEIESGRMADNMKLTQKQQEIIDRFLELENEYGKGNIFIRWINNYWNTMFVIHQRGEEKIETHLQESFKVNGRILNALEKKGLLQCQDINHEIVKDSTLALYEGIKVVGSRILV